MPQASLDDVVAYGFQYRTNKVHEYIRESSLMGENLPAGGDIGIASILSVRSWPRIPG